MTCWSACENVTRTGNLPVNYSNRRHSILIWWRSCSDIFIWKLQSNHKLVWLVCLVRLFRSMVPVLWKPDLVVVCRLHCADKRQSQGNILVTSRDTRWHLVHQQTVISRLLMNHASAQQHITALFMKQSVSRGNALVPINSHLQDQCWALDKTNLANTALLTCLTPIIELNKVNRSLANKLL